jgi:cleavage and polyadenylation specificity factor subunit 4
MLMQDIIAPVQNIHFDLDEIVCSQQGALPLPFPNMDKANVGVCEFFLRSNCSNQRCPFRHIHGDKTVVCKHWLRGLCKKGRRKKILLKIFRLKKFSFQVMIVNFFMNMIWLKCLNVISFQNLDNV